VTAAPKGATCPSCRKAYFFLDDRADFEAHMAAFPAAPIVLNEGIDVRGWAASRELVFAGARVVVTRKDVIGNRVYPVRCPGCSTVYIVRNDIVNIPEVEHYEKNVRPYRPPSPDSPAIDPKWGYRGQSVADFCADVKAIKNPAVRAFVARAVRGAGLDLVGLRDVDTSGPFQK
jgi:hypothetical protein